MLPENQDFFEKKKKSLISTRFIILKYQSPSTGLPKPIFFPVNFLHEKTDDNSCYLPIHCSL